MSKEQWIRISEKLELDLGREPTDEEVRDEIASECSNVHDMIAGIRESESNGKRRHARSALNNKE